MVSVILEDWLRSITASPLMFVFLVQLLLIFGGIKIVKIIREIWPFILMQYGVLFLCMLLREIVLIPPRLAGF